MPQKATAPPTLRLEVSLIPAQTHHAPLLPKTACIVVDVIRATTTLSVLFERGCRRVLIAPDVAAARAAHQRAGEPRPLLAGESGGVAPPGFDCGNSPAEFAAREVAGRDLIFATTNGTRALQACAGSGAIFAGTLRNAGAVVAAALAAVTELQAAQRAEAVMTPLAVASVMTAAADRRDQASEAGPPADPPPDIVVVCSGRGDRPAYDDTLCAGYLVREMARQAAVPLACGDGARIALTLAECVPPPALRDHLALSGAADAIRRAGLEGDLDWCAALDVASVVPRVVGAESGLLVMMAG